MGTGRMVKEKEKEYSPIQIKIFTLETGLMDKKKALAHLFSLRQA